MLDVKEWTRNKTTVQKQKAGTPILCCWEYKIVLQFWKMIWLFLIKPSIILPYNPAILLLRSLPNRDENICPKIDLYGNAHRSVISNKLKLETAQMFINPRMDKKIVVYVYNRVLASNKKEQTIDISNNVNKS